mmetsp:Transcript_61298/g.134280  ORF Transcript_61298/g.134280 Transcript_61298/m.134280 type:complete len:239 (+) Transcript_61298:71-787(+)
MPPHLHPPAAQKRCLAELPLLADELLHMPASSDCRKCATLRRRLIPSALQLQRSEQEQEDTLRQTPTRDRHATGTTRPAIEPGCSHLGKVEESPPRYHHHQDQDQDQTNLFPPFLLLLLLLPLLEDPPYSSPLFASPCPCYHCYSSRPCHSPLLPLLRFHASRRSKLSASELSERCRLPRSWASPERCPISRSASPAETLPHIRYRSLWPASSLITLGTRPGCCACLEFGTHSRPSKC